MSTAVARKPKELAENGETAVEVSPFSPKRQEFLRRYTDPGEPTYGNMSAACRACGLNVQSTHRWWHNTRNNPKKAGYLRRLMDENGLTDDFLAKRNLDLLRSGEGKDVAAALRIAHSVKGNISNAPQVQQLFVQLNVTGEDELRSIVAQHRALGDYSVEDAKRDCVDGLKTVLKQHPEWEAEIRLALFGEREIEPE